MSDIEISSAQADSAQKTNKSGMIPSFLTMAEIYIDRLRLELRLNMPLSVLLKLRRHYSEIEKRNATYEEICFLDSLYTLSASRGARIVEFSADDAFVYETFSDLIEKYYVLNKKNTAPSLEDIASTAGLYLGIYAGKKTSFENKFTAVAGENASLRLAAAGSVPVILTELGGAGAIRRNGFRYTMPGDLIALLISSAPMTRAEYKCLAVRTFLSCPNGLISSLLPLGKSGILDLLDKFPGLFINLPDAKDAAHFSEKNFESDAENDVSQCSVYDDFYARSSNRENSNNATCYENDTSSVTDTFDFANKKALCYQIASGLTAAIVSYARFSDLANIASQNGLKTVVIGNITSEPKVTLIDLSGALISFSSTILKYLDVLPELNTHIISQSESVKDLNENFLNRRAHRYKTVQNYDGNSKILFVSSAITSSKIPSSPFFAAHDLILNTMARCIATGAVYTDTLLSISINIPGTVSDVAQASLALFLGLYRAQIEYCLADKNSNLQFDSEDFKLTVCASALADNPPLPSRLTSPGSRVYLLTAERNKDGLPNYEKLRLMWDYAAAAIRSGYVKSAMLPEEFLDCITNNSDDTLSPVFSPLSGALDRIISAGPGALVIESSCPLEKIIYNSSKKLKAGSDIERFFIGYTEKNEDK